VPKERWGGEYKGYDNNDEKILLGDSGKPARYIDIYRLIKESYTSLVKIVAEVTQPYSMEYKTNQDVSNVWGFVGENKSG
jgi:hypothetical protein